MNFGNKNKIIAIVEDEPDILELIRLNVQREGYKAQAFNNAEELYRYLRNNVPDLLILDLMLPDADGYDICRLIKRDERLSSLPVIILSARAEEIDKILGLELGADDYMTKPFSIRELIARIRAVLRRGSPSSQKSVRSLKGGAIEINPEQFECIINGKKVDLSSTEFRILEFLSDHPGRVCSREAIIRRLWGNQEAVITRTIDVHIKNLRSKLGKEGNIIKNIRGIGYKVSP